MSKKTTVAILYGGKTTEHEVSKISAASVIRNFDASRFALELIGIDKDGQWYLQNAALLNRVVKGADLEISRDAPIYGIPGRGLITSDGKALLPDIVFPVLHGTNGEDGTVQGFLETLELPYTGAGILTSALGMDKLQAKMVWKNAELPIVPFAFLSRQEKEKTALDALFDLWTSRFGLPFFIKPCCAGSSVGVSKIKSGEQLAPAIEDAFRFDNRILIEQAIDAREIECSVLGNEHVQAFPPGEVISHHEFYDYSGKYLDSEGASFIIPAQLSDELCKKIEGYAMEAFRLIGAWGLARVDFFVERGSEKIYLNEINTLPGFTSISMYAKMCAAGGMSFPHLLENLVTLGMERHAQKTALNFQYDG